MLSYPFGLEIMHGMDINYANNGNTALGIAIDSLRETIKDEDIPSDSLTRKAASIRLLIEKGATLALYSGGDNRGILEELKVYDF